MSGTRRGWLSALVLLVLVAACVAIWYLRPYPSGQAAIQAMQGGEGIIVMDTAEWIMFEGGQTIDPSLIFYPGTRVKAESYAPLARLLAAKGYRVFIARMPFNLPVLDVERANRLFKSFPDDMFVIGGHALGGAMAAQFAAEHPERISGVFLLGAYPDQRGDLSETELPVLSLLGSRDGLVNREKYERGKTYLPADTVYMSIEGGNHAQFGSYGAQQGDGTALITPEEQWQQTAVALEQWLLNSVLRTAYGRTSP